MSGSLAAFAAFVLSASAQASPPASTAETTVIVYLGDGSSLPLRGWTLSYDYMQWPKGRQPTLQDTRQRESHELFAGKKVFPLAGTTLEIVGEPGKRPRLLVSGQEASEEIKADAPQRELLAPEADKSELVSARSLDLRGATLTGTKREFCVVSYTALVRCGGDPAFTVVKIEFPR